jgi:hypothetical protein
MSESDYLLQRSWSSVCGSLDYLCMICQCVDPPCRLRSGCRSASTGSDFSPSLRWWHVELVHSAELSQDPLSAEPISRRQFRVSDGTGSGKLTRAGRFHWITGVFTIWIFKVAQIAIAWWRGAVVLKTGITDRSPSLSEWWRSLMTRDRVLSTKQLSPNPRGNTLPSTCIRRE